MSEHQGLSSEEVSQRLRTYGSNDVEMRKGNFVKKFLVPLVSPISLMLLAAAALSRFSGKNFDFYFILVLYAVNYLISKWQEFKADKAIKELRDKLSFAILTLRDGTWTRIDAKALVPGDRIRLTLGGMIPADATIVSQENLSVNESVISGESLPKEKKQGDTIYSGSFVSTGEAEADIVATGRHTLFGKTVFSIEGSSSKSILEKDIIGISRFLTTISLCAVSILTVWFLLKGSSIEDILTLDLSLVIAGIPVALPAVMAVILSIGAGGLAKKSAVVRRLSALQDLSNVNLLLTDKTGTLTKNEISIADVKPYGGMSVQQVLGYAFAATEQNAPSAIDDAIEKKFTEAGAEHIGDVAELIPYDSDRKRTTARVRVSGREMTVSLGASQVIASIGDFASSDDKTSFAQDIEKAASAGFRTMAVAAGNGWDKEDGLRVIGMLYLADPLDESSKPTIGFMRDHGIDVRMVTGDSLAISQRVAADLGLSGSVISASETRTRIAGPHPEQALADIAAFAEVLPKDKYEIIKAFEHTRIVAATGDGVNDLPALKVAHVGIAVSAAVPALKSMADIVLLGRGLSVIKDAVIESRKIFARLYNYSIYRISESFRLVVTILLLGITYGFYPLVPIQLILLALLNDIPIISLATDRVIASRRPAEINAKERLAISILFGMVGVANSIFLFLLMTRAMHLPLAVIQTMFFLKLTVSGHALIFVARTKGPWFRSMPGKAVIGATISTQIVATILAYTGFLMPAALPPYLIVLVWAWSLIWMQISDLVKWVQERFVRHNRV